MKLSAADISAIYEELGTMRVELSPDANKGLQYVKERLTLCRAMQDRLGELTLKANRALSEVMGEVLALKMKHALSPDTQTQQRIREVDGERQDHLLLTKMCKMQDQLLNRTAMDVRLLADLTAQQIKLGEIDPKEAPGLVHETTVEDLLPAAEPAAPVAAEEPSNVYKFPEGAVPTIPMTFDGPSATMVNNTEGSSIDFDDLFGELNGQAAARVY